jgi:prepilin-type N-terminal cleavage/methylation domain-containing protein
MKNLKKEVTLKDLVSGKYYKKDFSLLKLVLRRIYKRGFTLVELIVAITILVILSAIGYVSYVWYINWVRDTNRISQLKSIRDSLNIYKIKTLLPVPDDKINIESNWSVIAYQWYAWKSILWKINYNSTWKDPKNGMYFSYYVTKNKKYFQLLWYLEDEFNMTFNKKLLRLSRTKAVDYSIQYPYVVWSTLWILIWTWSDSNVPVQEISSVKTAWKLDIKTSNSEYTAILKNNETISGEWIILCILKQISKEWWRWYGVQNNILYNTFWDNYKNSGCNFYTDTYVDGYPYAAWDQIIHNGIIYECKPWPVTAWCQVGGSYYEPWVWSTWTAAWIEIWPY